MSAQVDNGFKHPKAVRQQHTPDYIPTISESAILHNPSSTKATRHAQKQWGRIKNVAQIQNDFVSDSASEDSPPDTPLCKSIGIEDFQRTAKLLIRSKQAIKKVRSRCKENAMKKLLRSNTQSVIDIIELGPCLDSEMFKNYSLSEMHHKLRKQRHLKIAVLQKKFLEDFPELAEMSVKERLARRIEVLEWIKSSKYVSDYIPPDKPEPVFTPPDVPKLTRRQSRLRMSFDRSNSQCQMNINVPELLQAEDPILSVPLTVGDVMRELAVSRSREKIEVDLNLPDDRLVRFATLKANVEKINTKFYTFVSGKKLDGRGIAKDVLHDEEPYYAPSRFTQTGMAKAYFRKYARIVLIVKQWISMIMDKQYDFEQELKSFVDIANEIEENVISSTMSEFGLSFDKKFFKANTEISLSSDVRKILTTKWWSRTPKMIKQVQNGLQSLRSLSEYPLQTQEKLCKVAWYQTLGAKKAIVRQGHHAESFYFILSGMAFVKKMVQDPVTGDCNTQVAARLTKGHSFGEIGLLFDTLRTATVESATPMELLVIGKEDFVRIFMKAENPDEEPDHVIFLRRVPFMKDWPTEVLKLEAGACLTHYFKRGSLVTDNDRHSEWIYIVMSGTCEVLKKLKAVKGRHTSELRPKSDPMSDIILPELGMPNNYAKINTGKSRKNKRTIHPEVFKDMSKFYECLRTKYETDSPKTPSKKAPPTGDDAFMRMPDQTDKQALKFFMHTASARKFSVQADIGPRVRFMEEQQEKNVDINNKEVKLEPLMTDNKQRPVSRARFDESIPKVKRENFMLPSHEKLSDSYRKLPRDNDQNLPNTSVPEDVFVKVELLYPKNCFGLNTLKYVLDADDEVFDVGVEDTTPILSLVSRGAEVIMLSKKVFLKYADQRCKTSVREHIKVYPSEDVMQGNMQIEADWCMYKEMLLSQYVNRKLGQEKHRSKSNVF